MGIKRGYIVDEDTPPSVDRPKIRRFRLVSGEHVYLPLDVAADMVARHSPAEEFFFLERGLLGRTAWAGNLHDLRVACEGGLLSQRDLGGLKLPEQRPQPGWSLMVEEDDHARLGGRAAELATLFLDRGMQQAAETLTVEAWARNVREEGLCSANRPDPLHGEVWCGRDEVGIHSDPHLPVCPTCRAVKILMYLTAHEGGAWN